MAVLPTGIGPVTGYNIERSLRFNSADSAYLNRTPGSAGNRTTWTWSGWIKFSKITGYQYIFGASSDNYANSFTLLQMDNSASTLTFYDYTSAFNFSLAPTMVFRDPSAWYHIVLVYDSNNATSSDRVRMYVNGNRITNFSTTPTYPTSGKTSVLNSTVVHNHSTSSYPVSGYLTEINFIDGSALTPSSFGETDSATGVWKPKAYTGTYGTNGFFLKFADNSGTTSTTLGKDSSGNGNNWTPNNFSVTAGAGNDSMADSPTAYGTDTGAGGSVRGNYATWNPLMKASQVTLTNGNLDAAHGTFGTNTGVFGGIAVSSGKWYWEETITALSSGAPFIGIMKPEAITQTFTTFYANTTSGYAYRSTGDKRTNSSDSAYGASYTTNDVIGVALDMDAGTLVFYKNGASQGTAFSSLSGTFVAADANGTSGGTYSSTINFGQRAFAYTAPSGFKALCTTNLPTPTIGATSTTLANDYFDVTTYSGQNTSLTVTNSGSMQPDFVWIKSRNSTDYHNLVDAVRGTNKNLFSNTTDAEDTVARLTSFNSNGITLAGSYGYTNISGQNYVAWQWNAGGSNATNTSGTITSTVRANTTSGFSIVTYTGTGSNATVGHGLGVAPQMVIVKNRDTSATDWPLWHKSLGGGQYRLYLNLTSSSSTASSLWNNTEPTSTTISVGTSNYVNENTKKHVAYCFAPVAGYSAFGSYTGNGAADGPFVYLGFRPKYILLKRTDTSFEQWWIHDSVRGTYNAIGPWVYANLSNAEQTGDRIDFLSNGFKLRGAFDSHNGSGGTYVYACFAESPFKYSLAR
jgi:hypothetical protein